MRKFESLPVDVQEKSKRVLKAYDEVTVVYEYGRYEVSPHICIKASYGSDHEVCGRYFAKDIFTPEQRILNYVESFHQYPIEYKGKRDYVWIDTLTWDDKVKFDNAGNIVSA